MIVAVAISYVLLGVAALFAVIRVVRGPSVADRMVALDTLLFLGVGSLGVYIGQTRSTAYVPVLLVAVLTAFISTVVVARYIEVESDE